MVGMAILQTHASFYIQSRSLIQWFSDNPIYEGKENHLQSTGRHKKPARSPSPSDIWNISFPESDPEQ